MDVVYSDYKTFLVFGDQTVIFNTGTLVETTCSGVIGNGAVASVSYSLPNTTVELTEDSDSLNEGLTSVRYGVTNYFDIPPHKHDVSDINNFGEGIAEQVNFTNLNNNGSVGYNSYQVAQGDHSHAVNHSMTDTTYHSADNWKLFYSDGDGEIKELSIGPGGTYLKSDGASSIPSWGVVPTVFDKIQEGNSSVEVVDTGTGYINFTADGSVVARMHKGSGAVTSNFRMGSDLTSVSQDSFVSTVDSYYNVFSSRCYSDTAAHAGDIEFKKGRGTYTSPSAVQDDDSVGVFVFGAINPSASTTYSAKIAAYVNDTPSSTSVPMRLSFETSNTTSAARAERLVIESTGETRPGADDTYDLGTASYRWDDVYATNNTIQTSDERKKENITTSDLGLAFIRVLNPVSYKWKDYTVSGTRMIDYKDDSGNIIQEEIEYIDEHTYTRTHYGMIAQDVETTLNRIGKDGKDFAGFIYNEETDDYGLRYSEFIAPMIKAIQEQQDIIEELKNRIEKLEKNN